MIDVPVRRLIDPWLERLARRLVDTGISANMLTWIGFAAGFLAAICVGLGWFTIASGLIAINRLCDGLDGCVARIRGPSDAGGYLDIVLDIIFYSAIPFGFAVYAPQNQLPAAFLIYSFVGTGGSFLAYAIVSAKRGQTTNREHKKSFFYSVGLIEGTETVVFLLLICIVPQHFPLLAWIFGSLCWLTTAIRVRTAMKTFQLPAAHHSKNASHPPPRSPDQR